jgi:hypothetical protein
VFWVNVPFGIFGTIWAYRKLIELGTKKQAKIDWLGNITFAVGLVALLTGIGVVDARRCARPRRVRG